jgi:hypothetical protein
VRSATARIDAVASPVHRNRICSSKAVRREELPSATNCSTSAVSVPLGSRTMV